MAAQRSLLAATLARTFGPRETAAAQPSPRAGTAWEAAAEDLLDERAEGTVDGRANAPPDAHAHSQPDTRAHAPPDERALVAAARGGDRAAAETLAARTYTVVFRVLCQLCRGDAVRAADLVQETYRRAWGALDRFEERASFSTWLCRIGYNAFIDQTRRTRDMPGVHDALDAIDVVDPAPRPGDELAEREIHDALRRAVLALPDELRFTVIARFWGEATIPDIARNEGISEVAVRKRLRRAFAQIAAALPAGAMRALGDEEDGP